MKWIHNTQGIGCFACLALVLFATGCSEAPPSEPTKVAEEKAPARSEGDVVRGGIEFVQGYAKGYAAAKKADLPMLVFFTAKWCSYCHQMEQDAFADNAVATLAKRFVCVLVDADAEPEVCEKFALGGLPTIQFMTSHGVPLNRVTGRRPAEQILSQMEDALEAAALRAQHTGESLAR